MDFRVMPKGRLNNWIATLLARNYKVVGPQELHGKYIFDELTDIKALVMDYPQTAMPPKQYLLPPREVLFSFNTQTMDMETHIEAEPTVLLGLHTCDMHAIQLLDKIQNTGFVDQHYKARRDATYLVSLDCNKPCSDQAFCKDMETFSVPENYDVHLIDMGDAYAVSIGSEKGEKLFEGCVNLWSATEDDKSRFNVVMAEKWENFTFKLDFDLFELPDILASTTKSDLWDQLGDICLACGACTQVCPTCYCFDVTDEVDLKLEEGQRVRTWDSCQIEKFAMVAGGHNFRTSLALRQRHRFMRKGKYQYEAYGQMGCVGCGRCGTACLVNITSIDTYNRLNQEYKEQQLAEVES